MRVLLLTNPFPFKGNLASGIFITKRLEQYRKFGIDYTAVPVWFEEDAFLRLIRRVLRKNVSPPIITIGEVEYSPLKCKRTIFWLWWEMLRRVNPAIEPHVIAASTKRFVKCLERSFDISSFDLIHAHGMYTPPAGLVASALAQKYSKPYVVTVHGSDVNVLMEKRRKIYLDVLESAKRVIFVSNALVEKAKSFGYSGRNAVVIPNGYDPAIFKPLDKDETRRELGIYDNGYKYVGFVGNLIEIKRADKLIEIFARVSSQIEKVRFIIVGDGHLKDKMENEARQRNLEVLFTGRVNQEGVAKYMNAMDGMVLPSRNEGWPCVVLEAQACGTCVVGSSNGGIPEAIGFKEYIVEEGKDFEERFAQKVVKLLREGYDREALINRAKEYTWESIVMQEKRVCESVLRKKKK